MPLPQRTIPSGPIGIGVPTRLIDWTASPLVATSFAIESDGDVIYAVKFSRYIHEVERHKVGPFDNSSEGRFTVSVSSHASNSPLQPSCSREATRTQLSNSESPEVGVSAR